METLGEKHKNTDICEKKEKEPHRGAGNVYPSNLVSNRFESVCFSGRIGSLYLSGYEDFAEPKKSRYSSRLRSLYLNGYEDIRPCGVGEEERNRYLRETNQ